MKNQKIPLLDLFYTNIIITWDTWSIEKEGTIGLFGRENQTVNDMLLRFANGTNNCDTFAGDPLVVREAPDEGDAAASRCMSFRCNKICQK